MGEDGGTGDGARGPGGPDDVRAGGPPELGSVWVAALKAAVLVVGGFVAGLHAVVGLVRLVW